MTHSAPPDHRYADDHLAELTDRQRRVLDLIAGGKTNAQIGEALGITLDGAKWNVSEILTRLGFSSREEAAEYWRSRHRIRKQLARPLRALLGLPLVVKAAGAAGAVAVAGLGAWWAFAGSRAPERASTQIPPFYLEASVEVTSGPSGGSPGSLDTTRTEIRWWFLSHTEFRSEITYTEGEARSAPTLVIADRSALWMYSSAENAYTKSSLPEASDVPMAPGAGPYLAFGPLRQRTMDTFLATIRSAGSPPMQATIVGGEEMLGWQTLVVEVKAGETVSRIWVDPKHMLVVKVVSEHPVSFHMEVTTIRYNESIPRDRLRFEPPAGARLVVNLGSSSDRTTLISLPPTVSGAPAVLPDFLGPSYIPAGYSARGTTAESHEGTQGPVAIEITFARGDGASGFISLRENIHAGGGLPAGARTDQRIAVNGHEAYRSEAIDFTSIWWSDGDLVIVLSANALTFDELMRMAESIGSR